MAGAPGKSSRMVPSAPTPRRPELRKTVPSYVAAPWAETILDGSKSVRLKKGMVGGAPGGSTPAGGRISSKKAKSAGGPAGPKKVTVWNALGKVPLTGVAGWRV